MSRVSGIVHQLLTRRGITAALACAATVGTLGAVGVGNAGAVVNSNGLDVAYTLGGTGCRAVVGDQKSSTAAIGEVDVTRCPYYYNIEDWVQLQISSSPNGRWSPYLGYVTSGHTYQLDDATAPECGAHYWRTVADVRIRLTWPASRAGDRSGRGRRAVRAVLLDRGELSAAVELDEQLAAEFAASDSAEVRLYAGRSLQHAI